MATAVIATIGEDRPGLVNELSELVVRLNLNIEDSRMTVLAGEFAVLMSVAGEDAQLDELEQQLNALCADSGLAHLFRRSTQRAAEDTLACQARVIAMDHPGIVNRIAGFFSSRGINIRELNTETEHAAHTGTPIFNLTLTVELPAHTNAATLASAFEAFCDEHGLDGTLRSD